MARLTADTPSTAYRKGPCGTASTAPVLSQTLQIVHTAAIHGIVCVVASARDCLIKTSSDGSHQEIRPEVGLRVVRMLVMVWILVIASSITQTISEADAQALKEQVRHRQSSGGGRL